MITQPKQRALSLALVAVLAALTPPAWAVDYANITVTDGATPHTDPPTVSIPAGQGTTANAGLQTEGFFIDSGAVVGEYPVRIGNSAADDANGGILIASVSEFGREVAPGEILYATISTALDDHYTSTNTRSTAGALAIVTDRGGNNVEVGSNFPLGAPMNANVGAAYFPFSQGWMGATALNSSDGGTYDQLIQNGGFQLGVNVQQDFFGPGDNRVAVPGVQDTRRQGILLAMTAHNEDNFAVVSYTADGDAYNVTTRANSANGGDAETDPISFVYVPFGTANVTMANIFGSTGQNAQPYVLTQSGSPFTITREDDVDSGSHFRLAIPGESPTSGVLLLQSTGNEDGDGGAPADNLITYEADGNDWIIRSDDLPTANGANQIPGMGERQPYFQFVFMPFDTPPTAPGALPQLDWTKKSVFGASFEVVEIDGADNDQNDGTVAMYTNTVGSTANVEAVGLRLNRGDNSPAFDGVLPTLADGVMFATISEGLRDNSATSGNFEYGVAAVSLTGSPASWEVHTHVADPSNGEHNINFASVVFGSESGFEMAAQQQVDSNGHLDVTISGVNSLTDGVLMATSYGNDDNFATVEPKSDGSGWSVDNYDNGTTGEGDLVNWIFLPYETENLVAGRVNTDGSIVNSTDSAGFTLTRDADGEYLLTVNGRTPDEGMLLLNATGPNGSLDNHMVYEADGNAFRIIGLDMITSAESTAGEFVEPEDTSFSFAFIDFVTPPQLPGGDFLAADFNQDGSVDGNDLTIWETGYGVGTTNADGDADGNGTVDGGDFLLWQSQVGMTPSVGAAGAVPEPAALGLLLTGAALAVAVRRRSA